MTSIGIYKIDEPIQLSNAIKQLHKDSIEYILTLASDYPNINSCVMEFDTECPTKEELQKRVHYIIEELIFFGITKAIHIHATRYKNIRPDLEKTCGSIVDRKVDYRTKAISLLECIKGSGIIVSLAKLYRLRQDFTWDELMNGCEINMEEFLSEVYLSEFEKILSKYDVKLASIFCRDLLVPKSKSESRTADNLITKIFDLEPPCPNKKFADEIEEQRQKKQRIY